MCDILATGTGFPAGMWLADLVQRQQLIVLSSIFAPALLLVLWKPSTQCNYCAACTKQNRGATVDRAIECEARGKRAREDDGAQDEATGEQRSQRETQQSCASDGEFYLRAGHLAFTIMPRDQPLSDEADWAR